MKSAPLLTIGGTLVDVYDPAPGIEKLDLWEVAHCLSQLVRFTGNMWGPYSVGQHCCLAHDYVGEYTAHGVADDRLKRTALFHDAAEMLIGDLPGPFKRMMGPEYKDVEIGIEAALAARFDLLFPFPPVIKTVDLALLETEMRDLTAWDVSGHRGSYLAKVKAEEDGRAWPGPIEGVELEAWDPRDAYAGFMQRARALEVE